MVLPTELRERFQRLHQLASRLGDERAAGLMREITLKAAEQVLAEVEATVSTELRQRQKANVKPAAHVLPQL